MQTLDANFITSLQAAREGGIAPVYFFHVIAKDRSTGAAVPWGFWTGDEDIARNVQTPTGGTASRTYYGGANMSVANLEYVADLTDQPVTVGLSQIAPAVQEMVRGSDVRLAYCEIHATSWVGGNFASVPQLQWIGIVDDVQIATPSVGGEGNIALTVRSELMSQLQAINPAKSSDSHQKRRQSGDRFSEYASTIRSRSGSWYKA